MRLNKYLSESGACSRREADTFIEEGRVTINGVPATLGTQVNDGDEVKLDGDIVGGARKKARPVYIALNKPVGITCTTERHVAGNIVDFVDHPERVFPIGRLDKDSSGLVLVTDNGALVHAFIWATSARKRASSVKRPNSLAASTKGRSAPPAPAVMTRCRSDRTCASSCCSAMTRA